MTKRKIIKQIKAIDYSQIDIKAIPLVKFFNKIGLITEFSCEGHEGENINRFGIIFDKCVTDKMIFKFLNVFQNGNKEITTVIYSGAFHKWCRLLNDEVQCNWLYIIDYSSIQINHRIAINDLRIFERYHVKNNR